MPKVVLDDKRWKVEQEPQVKGEEGGKRVPGKRKERTEGKKQEERERIIGFQKRGKKGQRGKMGRKKGRKGGFQARGKRGKRGKRREERVYEQ